MFVVQPANFLSYLNNISFLIPPFSLFLNLLFAVVLCPCMVPNEVEPKADSQSHLLMKEIQDDYHHL